MTLTKPHCLGDPLKLIMLLEGLQTSQRMHVVVHSLTAQPIDGTYLVVIPTIKRLGPWGQALSE